MDSYRTLRENSHVFRGDDLSRCTISQLKWGEEIGYTPSAPQGAKKQLAASNWQFARRPVLGSWYLVLGIWYLVKLCDPLPTDASAEGYNGEKTSKMTPIWLAKTTEQGFRPLGRQFGRIAVRLLFSTNAYGGWGRGL